MSASDLLSPDEPIVAERAWRGYPPIGRALAVALLVLGLVVANTAHGVYRVATRFSNYRIFPGVTSFGIVSWEGPLEDDELAALGARATAGGSFGGSNSNARGSYSYHGGGFFTPAWLIVPFLFFELRRIRLWRRKRAYVGDRRVVALDHEGRWLGQAPIASGASEGEIDATSRALLRRRATLFHVDVEDVLLADEKLAWEGRPTGRAPIARLRIAAYVAAFILYSTLVAFDLYSTAFGVGGSTGRVWINGKEVTLRETRTRAFEWKLGTVGARQTTTSTGPGGTGGTATQAVSWPSPLALFPLFAAIELVLLAMFRARRYGVTDRRVIALGWRGRGLGQVARSDVASVAIEARDVVVIGRASRVRLERLDDPEAARSAIEAEPAR